MRERARPLRVADTAIEVQVAALADIEHSKRTAARPKDLDYLQSVGRLQAPAAAVADGAGAQAVSQARGEPERENPDQAFGLGLAPRGASTYPSVGSGIVMQMRAARNRRSPGRRRRRC